MISMHDSDLPMKTTQIESVLLSSLSDELKNVELIKVRTSAICSKHSTDFLIRTTPTLLIEQNITKVTAKLRPLLHFVIIP